MVKGRLHIEAPLPAAEALARGLSLLESLDSSRPFLLYGAPLEGAAVALGAYQHAPHALRAAAFEAIALPVLRRQTGGAAVWCGEGVLYGALGLSNASLLMACPPGRILNRNVRGLLAGLRALHAPAHYFGRDFVSLGAEPVAYVGWDQAVDGRVLLEFFVALETPFTLAPELEGYPERAEPALRGKRPTKLRAALPAISAVEVFDGIAGGYAKAFAVELERQAPGADELARATALRASSKVDLADDGALCWSSPHEDAIGFVSAGVRLDPSGRFKAIQVGGDFFQQRGCPTQLAARLIGEQPSAQGVGAALDDVYGSRPGQIEGLRSLGTLRTAILEAVAKAAASALPA
jgi:hypothetical protein